ncbi:MAG: hypothetical protein JF586_14365 [Burkholderiales bacterium]|nr:hypothetical protein [Burkholderiales bacterium]
MELYRDLLYLGELDDILGELSTGSRTPELGCGAGRLTRRLVAPGLSVTGCRQLGGNACWHADFNGQTYRFGYETGLPADA